GWNVELEAGDGAARADHADQLGDGGGRVGHVAQQVGEGQRVEGGVGEREPLGLPADQRDPLVQTVVQDRGPTTAQHRLGDVDPGDMCARPAGELEGDAGRAGGHVEHCGGVALDDAVDHGPAPAPV